MKNIVLFIVEGRNDQFEIEAILSTPFFADFMANYKPMFLITNGDILMKAPGKMPIRKVVGNAVQAWKRGDVDAPGRSPFESIKNTDIKEIVHIVDLDGTFVPNSSVVSDAVLGFVYEDEIIRAPKAEQVVQRNAIKRNNLKTLIETRQIDNLPYRIFFASCNMDHVLSNNRNASQKFKNRFSYDFGNLCGADPSIIFNSVLSSSVATNLSYEESWKSIMEGTSSLKRSTNINLFLREYGDF